MSQTPLHYKDVSSHDFAGQLYQTAADCRLHLDSEQELLAPAIAYETYGQLNEDKSNAILICHALTGDQFVMGVNPITKRDGWWDEVVGAGKAIDTNRYFVICSNVLGGCMGSTGPLSPHPSKKGVWGGDFPVLTIGDMVRAQKLLIEHLGIEQLYCVVGGSMGGMQSLQWAVLYPDCVHSVVAIATAARHSAQNISLHEIGRQAIVGDPQWHDGFYANHEQSPQHGLAVARMMAHVSYLSESALHRKFGRNLQNRDSISYGFGADFQVESYLRHQGSNFVARFDANSYLRITRAMDYFDLTNGTGTPLKEVFVGSPVRFCLFSFSSDWLFPTQESRLIVQALNAAAASVSFCEIASDGGHDSFLLHIPEFHELLHGFLDGASSHY